MLQDVNCRIMRFRYGISYRYCGRWRWRGPSQQPSSASYTWRKACLKWTFKQMFFKHEGEKNGNSSKVHRAFVLFFALTPAVSDVHKWTWMLNFSRSFHLWSSSGSPVMCHLNVCLSDSTGVHQSIGSQFPFSLFASSRSFSAFCFVR